MGFFRDFCETDSSKVDSRYGTMLLAFVLSIPIVCLSCACVVQHVFIMRKGLDAPVVNLLLGMLGAATGGFLSAGAGMFSKVTTSISEVTGHPRGPKPE